VNKVENEPLSTQLMEALQPVVLLSTRSGHVLDPHLLLLTENVSGQKILTDEQFVCRLMITTFAYRAIAMSDYCTCLIKLYYVPIKIVHSAIKSVESTGWHCFLRDKFPLLERSSRTRSQILRIFRSTTPGLEPFPKLIH